VAGVVNRWRWTRTDGLATMISMEVGRWQLWGQVDGGG
jgi:hypothetical protein